MTVTLKWRLQVVCTTQAEYNTFLAHLESFQAENASSIEENLGALTITMTYPDQVVEEP